MAVAKGVPIKKVLEMNSQNVLDIYGIDLNEIPFLDLTMTPLLSAQTSRSPSPMWGLDSQNNKVHIQGEVVEATENDLNPRKEYLSDLYKKTRAEPMEEGLSITIPFLFLFFTVDGVRWS